MDEALARFNGLPGQQARDVLTACCAADAWVEAVALGRPYPGREALATQARQTLAGLAWTGVLQALAAHPRIGERLTTAGQEAAWSATEQSGMQTASAQTRAALVEANIAYEQRFGHVLLVFATGKTDTDLLAAARARLHHDEHTERATVRAELAQIVALRLTKLLDGYGAA